MRADREVEEHFVSLRGVEPGPPARYEWLDVLRQAGPQRAHVDLVAALGELLGPNDRVRPPAGAAADVRPSDWTQSQARNVTDIDQAIYDQINKKSEANVEMRMKLFKQKETS